MLRERLEDVCRRRGATAFGVVSASAADELPPVKIEWTINRWSVPVRAEMPDARSVIVFGVPSLDDSDELAIQRSPGRWSYPGYYAGVLAARDMVQLLKTSGFNAAFSPGLASYKRLAILSGIGAYGKNSMVISPRYGPWLRFGAVVTNAPLPPDKPFTKDLCGRCRKCVSACPSGALKTPYAVDQDRCIVAASLKPRVSASMAALIRQNEPRLTPKTHVMCTRCQVVCPYTPAGRRRNSVPLQPAPRARRRRR